MAALATGIRTAAGKALPSLPHISTRIINPIPGALLYFSAERSPVGTTPIWRDMISGAEWKSNDAAGAPEIIVDSTGKKVLFFDGIDDMLTMPLPLNQPSTVIVVARFREVRNSSAVISGASGPANNIGANSASTFWVMNAGAVLVAPGAAAVDTASHIFMGVFNGANSVIRVDTNEATGDGGTNNRTLMRMGYGAGYERMNAYAVIVLPYAAAKPERDAIYAQLRADYFDA